MPGSPYRRPRVQTGVSPLYDTPAATAVSCPRQGSKSHCARSFGRRLQQGVRCCQQSAEFALTNAVKQHTVRTAAVRSIIPGTHTRITTVVPGTYVYSTRHISWGWNCFAKQNKAEALAILVHTAAAGATCNTATVADKKSS